MIIIDYLIRKNCIVDFKYLALVIQPEFKLKKRSREKVKKLIWENLSKETCEKDPL